MILNNEIAEAVEAVVGGKEGWVERLIPDGVYGVSHTTRIFSMPWPRKMNFDRETRTHFESPDYEDQVEEWHKAFLEWVEHNPDFRIAAPYETGMMFLVSGLFVRLEAQGQNNYGSACFVSTEDVRPHIRGVLG